MVVNIPPPRAGLLLEPAPWRDINLAANNWLQSSLPRRFVKINRSIQHTVVRDRYRRELQLMRLVHEPVQPATPIQQGILRVQMQMNKLRVRHTHKLPSDTPRKQARDVHIVSRSVIYAS